MNYNKIIIDGYEGRQTTSLVSYFKQHAQINKRDNFVEFADFFNGCKVAVSGFKKVIERHCARECMPLNNKIEYAKNYIEDDKEWEQFVISSGGVIDSRALEIREQYRYNRGDIIKNLEREKEKYQYEKFSCRRFTDNGDDYVEPDWNNSTSLRAYTAIPYNYLILIETAIHQAEQELTPAAAVKSTQQPKHFTRQFTDEQRNKLYQGLIDGGYLPADTPRNHFDFVFGQNDCPNDFKPLQWEKKVALLAYLVEIIFDCNFTIAKSCFFTKDKQGQYNPARNLKQAKDNYTNKKKTGVPKQPKDAPKILAIITNAGIK